MKRIYCAGPMSGIPEYNFPAFHAETARLRAMGYEVVNPAEINPYPGPWKECMRRDIAELVACDALVLLPGWERSKGAQLEYSIATALGFQIVLAAGRHPMVQNAASDASLQAVAEAERHSVQQIIEQQEAAMQLLAEKKAQHQIVPVTLDRRAAKECDVGRIAN